MKENCEAVAVIFGVVVIGCILCTAYLIIMWVIDRINDRIDAKERKPFVEEINRQCAIVRNPNATEDELRGIIESGRDCGLREEAAMHPNAPTDASIHFFMWKSGCAARLFVAWNPYAPEIVLKKLSETPIKIISEAAKHSLEVASKIADRPAGSEFEKRANTDALNMVWIEMARAEYWNYYVSEYIAQGYCSDKRLNDTIELRIKEIEFYNKLEALYLAFYHGLTGSQETITDLYRLKEECGSPIERLKESLFIKEISILKKISEYKMRKQLHSKFGSAFKVDESIESLEILTNEDAKTNGD